MNSSPPRRAIVSTSGSVFFSNAAVAWRTSSPAPAAERIVRRLEVIEIDKEHGERPFLARRPRQREREPVAKQGAVRQSGERIVLRKERELLVGDLPLGDVVEDGEDAGLAFV